MKKTWGGINWSQRTLHSPSKQQEFQTAPLINYSSLSSSEDAIPGGCRAVPSHMPFSPEPPTGRVLLSGRGGDPLPCQVPVSANDRMTGCLHDANTASLHVGRNQKILWKREKFSGLQDVSTSVFKVCLRQKVCIVTNLIFMLVIRISGVTDAIRNISALCQEMLTVIPMSLSIVSWPCLQQADEQLGHLWLWLRELTD